MNAKPVARASALIALLYSISVPAGVIYRWQDAVPNPNTGLFFGYIEFSYDAWAPSGHLQTSISAIPDQGSGFDPLDGIEGFYWSNPSGIGIEQHIEIAMQPCSFYLLPDHCGSDGANSTALARTGGGGFGATFDVTFGAILEGFLTVNDTSTDVRMRSAGPLWTIERTASDGPGICFFNDGRCWGSTGLWVLDLTTLPPVRVSEPSTVALMLFALVSLLGYRKFDRTSRRYSG